jgi:hypothetical protein
MQDLKPSVLMGKLKQHLPHWVSPDNDLFLTMFLIRLLLCRKQDGARNYKTPELGTRFFLPFALALSRSLAELFALALSRSFFGLKFRAFAFALSRSRAP